MNKQTPFLSILIPTYNCGTYILDYINSILSQSYQYYEILILDDGSVDDTQCIVENIKEPRITYIKNRTNQGIVKTLNKGIKLAKGEYIVRMDADDIMLGK